MQRADRCSWARCTKRAVPGYRTGTPLFLVLTTALPQVPSRHILLRASSLGPLRSCHSPFAVFLSCSLCEVRQFSVEKALHWLTICRLRETRKGCSRLGLIPMASHWRCLWKLDLLVRLSVTVVCYYSWASVRLLSSSSRLVRLNGDSMRHNGNRLALSTERTRLVWGDDQSVLSLRVCWPKSSKTSKSSVRSSRSRRKYTFFNLGESTINGLNDTCCEQLGVSFLATTGAGGGGAGGASAPPKVLIWWKSEQNPWKSGQNLWKPSQNLWKSEQTPENISKRTWRAFVSKVRVFLGHVW